MRILADTAETDKIGQQLEGVTCGALAAVTCS